MKKKIPFLLFLLLLMMACNREEVIIEEDLIQIRLNNQSENDIDSLKFFLESPAGTDSLLFTQVKSGELSDWQVVAESYYYYKEEGDIFIINEGKFVIDGEDYYLSNCFCDAELKEAVLPYGKYQIRVNGIDPLRKDVNYVILVDE
jgi:hypothetical protein